MQLRNIAWASVRRRPGRAAFTIVVVAVAIGTAVALMAISRVMQQEIGNELDRFGANIVITPKSEALDLAYGGVSVAGLTVDAQELKASDADLVRTIPNGRNVNAVAPKLFGTVEISGQRVLLVGVRHRDEARVKSWWQYEGRLPKTVDEVLLGSEAASALGKGAGQSVEIAGRARIITGLLKPSGTVDDSAVIAELEVVQAALNRPGAVSMIEVSALCIECPIEHMVEQIATVIPTGRVAPIRQAVAARERAVAQFTQFAFALSGIVLVVGMLVVAATMMASVVERTAEIGILRAVGYRRAQVGRIVLVEAAWVNLAGAVVGWLLGSAAARLLAPTVAGAAVSEFQPLAIVAAAAGALLGILASGYPALRAARMEPSHALRHL